ADDVAETLRAIDVTRADVIGWSLGGMVGAVLAADQARLVDRLVIVNSPPRALLASRIDGLRVAQRRALARLPLRWLGPIVARRAFPSLAHDELRRAFAERFARNDPASYRAALQAVALHDDTGVLERIASPLLIVAGDRDYWPVEAKRAQLRRARRGR